MTEGRALSSFESSAVKFGRTLSSTSFWRNAASYFATPRLRSQTTTSMTMLRAHPLFIPTPTQFPMSLIPPEA